MQLDLLNEPSNDTQETRNSSPRKTKPQKHPPVLKTKDISAAEPLPPLPESLRPPFIAQEDADMHALDEDGDEKAPGAFKTISEVARLLNVPQHVLRFWESRFSQIKPLKLHGGRRYYRPEDVQTLTTIQNLLYKQGYTIKGAKKAFSKKPADTHVPALESRASSPAVHAQLDKKQSQLTVLRHELIGLRETLGRHINK